MSPNALVIRTAGTNCDQETLHALKISGAKADLLHLREILQEPNIIFRYSILVFPGGFSYGDDISAGKLLANELKYKCGSELKKFVSEGRMVIGICNGFQVLVKCGLLPGQEVIDFGSEVNHSRGLVQTVTLTQNDSGRFQCEWVALRKESSRANWLKDVPKNFELPIAHGEGKFIVKHLPLLRQLEKNRQVVFRYSSINPNGSVRSIAGICNPSGNVIGMMPHPERYVTHYQHPSWTRRSVLKMTPGLGFWKSAVRKAKSLKNRKMRESS